MEAYQEQPAPMNPVAPQPQQPDAPQRTRLYGTDGNWLIGFFFSPVALLLMSFKNARVLSKLDRKFGHRLLTALVAFVSLNVAIIIFVTVVGQIATSRKTLEWLQTLGPLYLIIYIVYLIFYIRYVTSLERELSARAINQQPVIRTSRGGIAILGLIMNLVLVLTYGISLQMVIDSETEQIIEEFRQVQPDEQLQELKEQGVTDEEIDHSQAASRDITRLNRATYLITNLKWYFEKNGTYPAGENLVMGQAPNLQLCLAGWKNKECKLNSAECQCLKAMPEPADGNCTADENNLRYSVAADGQSFVVEFCLESVPSKRYWPPFITFEPRAGVNRVTPVE